MGHTPFACLAELGERLERTAKRLELTALLADFLTALEPEEIRWAVRMVIGQAFPESEGRALNMSWKAVAATVDTLVDAPAEVRSEIYAQSVDGGQSVHLLLERARKQPPRPPALTVLEVASILEQIAATSGRGAQARKEQLLQEMMARATAVEAKHLAKIIYQEMRHGVQEGLMLEGIARASGAKPQLVRQANQLWGDLGQVALVALTEGPAGLEGATVRLFHPIKPMLAKTAETLEEAFEQMGARLALEYKLDGARVQIHRAGDQVRLYSRQLADVTDSLPDLAAAVREKLEAETAILEGEAVAIDTAGRPMPFQELMRRFRRKYDVEAAAAEVPVQLYLFDLIYANGKALVAAPNKERWAELERVAGGLRLVRRICPASIEEGQAFAQAAREAGHEGLMAKALESAYTPGVRGEAWLKLKHLASLDLVIVAADWGYGRRHGWLSNYHLAARDVQSGDYMVVGKTFKGLTDSEFAAMTHRLLELEQSRRQGTVFVKPEVVVEVRFNEIQKSNQYQSGLALRFARIHRLREDKQPLEADTLQTLQGLYDRQFQQKGQPARA